MATVTIEVPDDVAVRILEALTTTEPRTTARPTTTADRAPVPDEPEDPWDSSPQPTTTGGSRSASTADPGPSRATSNVVTDAKGRQWSFNAPNAPDCQCGEAAVLVKGTTNDRAWSQWRCAKDYDDYKNKCQFSEFMGGK